MKFPIIHDAWYVIHDKSHYGPVSLDDLRYEAKLGRLHPENDMLWRSGLTSWIPAGSLDSFATESPVMPFKKIETTLQNESTNLKSSFLFSLFLWASVLIFLLVASFVVIMVAFPKEHMLRINLYKEMERVEAIWQKQ